MPIITREGKGSKLTVIEMDGNLEYLASSSFQNGAYTQTNGAIGEIIDITTSGSLIFQTPLTDGAAGIYTVDNFTTIGNGIGASLQIGIVLEKGSPTIDIKDNAVIAGGSGYAEGDRLTFSSNDIGGTRGSLITITLGIDSVNVEQTSTLGVRAGNINLQSPSITMLAPLIIMSSLPTSDPGIAGALYIMSQSLKVSLGR
jgi:hypothetical protein